MRMLLRTTIGALLGLCVLIAAPHATGAPFDDLLDSLTPQADVNDFANQLTPAERSELESRCRRLREQTEAQLAVVVVKSLEGGQIDDFTEKLFQRWGVGREDTDEGVMLLVALDDRKARIEVGYGLEDVLPDALCGRILREQLFPRFREGRYAEGLLAAVDRISLAIEDQRTGANNAGAPQFRQRRVFNPLWIFLPGFFLVVSFRPLIAAGGFLRRGQLARAVSGLFLPAILLLFLLGVGLPKWASAGMLVLDSLLVALGYLFNHRSSPRGVGRSSRNSDWFGGNWPTGGWSGGGFGGGFSSGGGGSWGGFGGGHSGGGGASGSW